MSDSFKRLVNQCMDAFRMRANPPNPRITRILDDAERGIFPGSLGEAERDAELLSMYNSAKNEGITHYWYEYYCDGHCTLCGNYGYIDTRNARTPAGVQCGRLNWCICPNGQTLRDQIGGHPTLSIDGRLGKAI